MSSEPYKAKATSDAEQRADSSLVTLARELIDKVGFEGAARYCHSVGWLGVLIQVEQLHSQH